MYKPPSKRMVAPMSSHAHFPALGAPVPVKPGGLDFRKVMAAPDAVVAQAPVPVAPPEPSLNELMAAAIARMRVRWERHDAAQGRYVDYDGEDSTDVSEDDADVADDDAEDPEWDAKYEI